LSMDTPKPLFKVAGFPIVQHHVESLVKIPALKEILFLGFYPPEMSAFLKEINALFPDVNIRYLQEYQPLGTAGGLHHFRDQIRAGNPDAIFVMNGDVCADFPLQEMLQFHNGFAQQGEDGGSDVQLPAPTLTLMTTEATRQQSLSYGCVVEDKVSHLMRHYVEKPSTYISSLVSCGVYIVTQDIFNHLKLTFEKKLSENHLSLNNGESEVLWLERDILPQLAGTNKVRVYQTSKWWSPVKTAASAIYANRHYLSLYKTKHPERLVTSSNDNNIKGNVYIHPTAKVHPTAVVGPNVSIGAHVEVGEGARIKESIVLERSVVQNHAVVIHTIIGKDSKVGDWCRVEGTPNDPNPNKPFAKMDNTALFNQEGKLNPSITIVGSNVSVPPEIILLNSIVLPDKTLSHSIKNEIVL